MSFTTSSEKGERYESIFARQSISAYLCGHLHAKFSKHLWRLHTVYLGMSDNSKEQKKVKKQFWEWELGDWKEYRMIRILAVDEGQVSFLDMELPRKHDGFQTTILITYPTDSRSMSQLSTASHSQLLRNDINALVFSAAPILNVTAKVFDTARAVRIVEEVHLQPAVTEFAMTNKQPLFHAKWNAENYISGSSATRYWLQISVRDSEGKETVSARRPFSIEGKLAVEYPDTWLAHLVFVVRWEDLYSILLWSNLLFLVMLLFLPKLLNHFMERIVSYQKWAVSVSISSPIQQRRILFRVLWFLIEGSKSRALWSAMVVYFLYLLRLPWFWGHATSENGDIAPMYMFGWKVNSPVIMEADKLDLGIGRLGNPDVMTITLPFMYLVVAPLILLIYSLYAERSATCLQSSTMKTREFEQKSQFGAGSSKSCKANITSLVCSNKILGGVWTRRGALLSACIFIACIHFKQCCALMAAYGVATVALSPAFSWVPILLLSSAVYSTSKI